MRDQLGNRIRKFFSSRDDGDEWLRRRRPELSTQGRAAMDLSDSQRVDAKRALAILAPHGASLTAAAQAFHDRSLLLKRTVPFAALRDEMVAAKKADRYSARYLGDLRTRLSAFGQMFDGRPVASIETREIDDWLRALTLSPTSRVNYRKVLMTAFQFAISRGYATENPVIKTARVRAVTTPGILTAPELVAFLTVADRRIVPSIVLSAFAGLRDTEVGRLTWEKINLAEGHITIDADVAKTESRRLAPITDNLRSWLEPVEQRTGAVRPSQRTTYLLFQLAKTKAVAFLTSHGQPCANLQAWPHNALRHSFVSYRLAAVANSNQVAEEAGHSVRILKKNYQKLVTPAQAAQWFAVNR
jgi:integrase